MTVPLQLAADPVLARRLRVVRGAAVVTLLLLHVPVPPWSWAEGSNAIALLPILLLSALFGAVLWRLRRPPYAGGLALAMTVGTALLGVGGLIGSWLIRDAGTPGSWWGFLALFGAVQAVLVAAALVTYIRGRHAAGEWPLVARPSPAETSCAGDRHVRSGVRVVRCGALASMLLLCVPFPPWRWVETPAALVLLLPLFLPFLLILGRLRHVPRKDGLALALGTGGVLFLGSVLVLAALAMSPAAEWRTLLWLALCAVSEATLGAAGVATYCRIGYAGGDWKLLVRGVVDPLVFFAVMALFIAGSAPYLR